MGLKKIKNIYIYLWLWFQYITELGFKDNAVLFLQKGCSNNISLSSLSEHNSNETKQAITNEMFKSFELN